MKKTGRRRALVALLIAVGLLLLALRPPADLKLIIYNPTPSVPEGLYIRTFELPAKGQLILFKVPDAVRDYSLSTYDKEPLNYFIKPVLGAGGDNICSEDGIFKINGEPFAEATTKDRAGHDVPVWEECRELSSDEFFVFSDRVSYSFDSRHYGPVHGSAVIGVFRPLWTKGE